MAAFVSSSSSSDVSESEIMQCSLCHEICDPAAFFCFEHVVCFSCSEENNCCSVSESNQINEPSGAINKDPPEKSLDGVKNDWKFFQRVPVEIHCPFTVCKESAHPGVPFEKFISHLTNDHRVTSAPDGDNDFTREMYVGKGNIWRFKRDGPKSPFLLHCYDFQFIQHSFCADGNVWFWISILGSKNDANKFKTVLTISHPSIKGRKLSWSGNVHVVNTTENDVHKSSQCLVVQKSIIDDYMDVENDKMLWKLKIEIELKDDLQDAEFLLLDESQGDWSLPKENSPPKSQMKRRIKGKGRKNKNC